MCGIAGKHGPIDPAAGRRMLDRLAHRGPDDSGSIDLGGAWLGHTRLSIVDIGGGSQPLGAGEGGLWLVGNGEIYNHEDVRESLDGRLFASRSDNEVALHLLEDRGPAALAELSGMYAVLAADAEGRFFAARDPVGIKPLYWARRGEETRFASEMRAFDPSWLPLVEAFPPGHYWTPEGGLVRFENAVPDAGQLRKLPGPEEPGAPIPDDVLTQTREVVADSVKRQMIGDVPVGVFLSGGLDSSLVAAVAAEYYESRGQRLQTFAVGTEDSPDRHAARRVAEHLGSEHHERVYTAEEALAVLPETVRVIESFDPSLVRSAVPNYLLAEMTAEHVKVVLTGEGADEIFAGYGYYHEEFADEDDLHAELVRTIEGLHNLNLQRADRVTMAHGLEARVPFLDREVIAYGLHLPAGWKTAGPEVPEKRLLREAFDGALPEDLLWREKAQFGTGSGAADVLTERIEAAISDAEFESERSALDPPLRTKEELAYYRILREALPGLKPGETIGRFARS
ncbi:MAG TPA: asparagine synthase (glutamine-hydrolyzing) [Solirubrobacterales bacterium]|nr:asparagine synthase (glutamine-hydrolyzing) [Solirubrobacterales bacterium]